MENKNTSRVVIGVLVVLVLLLGGYIAVSGGKSAATANGASEAAALPMETYQAQYVKPETPIDRSKNVTLPGWGGFTIPAKTKKITQGFEFHNPAENLWYEDWVSLDGTTLEKLVVDSGQTTELSHYLRLAGIQAEVTKVLDADPAYFEIQKTDAGAYTIEAVKGYKGEKTLTVQTDDGKQYTLTLTGKEECYYIAFGLYLEDGDELLFQSGLVAPGLYVQKMEMTRALAPGEYPAYVHHQDQQRHRKADTDRGLSPLAVGKTGSVDNKKRTELGINKPYGVKGVGKSKADRQLRAPLPNKDYEIDEESGRPAPRSLSGGVRLRNAGVCDWYFSSWQQGVWTEYDRG